MDEGPLPLRRYAGITISTVLLLFLVVPTALVVIMSFSDTEYLRFPPQGFSLRWYEAFFQDEEWISATLFSLKVASLTTLFSTVFGTLAAIALVRGTVLAPAAISALLLAPLIVPNIIVGIAVYLHFDLLRLNGTLLGFVLIHTALAVPYVVLIVSAALTRLDFSIEMAAFSLGASQTRVILEVTAPLVSPAIVAGAIFAFLASFDETVVSFFISGVENKTVTRKFLEDIDFNLSPIIAAVSTVFIIVTVTLMALGQVARRKAEAG